MVVESPGTLADAQSTGPRPQVLMQDVWVKHEPSQVVLLLPARAGDDTVGEAVPSPHPAETPGEGELSLKNHLHF